MYLSSTHPPHPRTYPSLLLSIHLNILYFVIFIYFSYPSSSFACPPRYLPYLLPTLPSLNATLHLYSPPPFPFLLTTHLFPPVFPCFPIFPHTSSLSPFHVVTPPLYFTHTLYLCVTIFLFLHSQQHKAIATQSTAVFNYESCTFRKHPPNVLLLKALPEKCVWGVAGTGGR